MSSTAGSVASCSTAAIRARVLRYPPVEILHEVRGKRVWFPVPGMYGGFDITLRHDVLDVKSWCRVVGGSGPGASDHDCGRDPRRRGVCVMTCAFPPLIVDLSGRTGRG